MGIIRNMARTGLTTAIIASLATMAVAQELPSPPSGSAPPPDAPAELLAPPSPPVESKVPSILVVLAHPDDEITIAPILSRNARSGGDVTLVFATSGAQGPGVSGLEPGEELAALREAEGRCASFALGLPEPIFWQLDDGQLAHMARAPDSAANDMIERVKALIALHQPQVIMTWGPDGGYGHADHRMVSNVVTQAVQSLGDARPDLLYAAIPAIERPDLPGFGNWATVHPSLVTDRIRYEFTDLEATRLAIDCYQSQFDEPARTTLPSLLHQHVWNGTVHFRLAFPGTS